VVEDLRGGGDETVILLQGKNVEVVELLHGTLKQIVTVLF